MSWESTSLYRTYQIAYKDERSRKVGDIMTKDLAFETWLSTINSERACGLATVLQANMNELSYEPLRMFVSEDVEMISNIGERHIEEQIKDIIKIKFTEKNPTSETIKLQTNCGRELQVFIDIYLPPIEIMIFGAGHDAIPVAKYSVSLGYRTIVVDARENFNNEEHFPGTERMIVRYDSFAKEVRISSRTYIIVMNHHLEKDQATLQFVLKSQAPYVGVLGPRSRRVRMIEALRSDGIEFTTDQLQKMYSPIGLDIGAESPEEIAMSILAEIIAVRNGHHGGFLQDSDVIHKFSTQQKQLSD